jgi:endoglucanase
VKALIRKLSEAYGPSGREDALRQIVRAELRGLSDYISEDPLGNLHAVIKQKSRSGRRIMLAAPMDEVGLQISHVDENGFMRFAPLGPLDPLHCVGARVRFADGRVGVIELESRREAAGPPTLRQLFVDVGAASLEASGFKPGESAVFDRPLAEVNGRLVGKALGGRTTVAVLLETLRHLKRTPHEVQFVFSVQEQVGSRGARTAAFGLEPEVALTLGPVPASDIPRGDPAAISLGRGPVINAREGSAISDPRLVEWMAGRASEAHLPHQLGVFETSASNPTAIQVSRAGVVTAGLGLPCRYLHTASEMVELSDAEAAVKLLLSLLASPLPF